MRAYEFMKLLPALFGTGARSINAGREVKATAQNQPQSARRAIERQVSRRTAGQDGRAPDRPRLG
jgi:hypothetical protein